MSVPDDGVSKLFGNKRTRMFAYFFIFGGEYAESSSEPEWSTEATRLSEKARRFEEVDAVGYEFTEAQSVDSANVWAFVYKWLLALDAPVVWELRDNACEEASLVCSADDGAFGFS